MKATAARRACVRASDGAIWQSIPLELAVSALFIMLAAGLKLTGVFP